MGQEQLNVGVTLDTTSLLSQIESMRAAVVSAANQAVASITSAFTGGANQVGMTAATMQGGIRAAGGITTSELMGAGALGVMGVGMTTMDRALQAVARPSPAVPPLLGADMQTGFLSGPPGPVTPYGAAPSMGMSRFPVAGVAGALGAAEGGLLGSLGGIAAGQALGDITGWSGAGRVASLVGLGVGGLMGGSLGETAGRMMAPALSAAYPGSFSPSNMPPQAYGNLQQAMFEESVGYGMANLGIRAGQAGVRGAATLGGAVLGGGFGGAVGNYIGESITGGPVGGMIGGLLGTGLGAIAGANRGGQVGELGTSFLGIAGERLQDQQEMAKTFRSEGYLGGFGSGTRKEDQGTIREMSKEISRMAGDPTSVAYDWGAIARGEDPGARAVAAVKRGLETQAFGTTNSYSRPEEFEQKTAEFLKTQNMVERQLHTTPSEATDIIAGLVKGGAGSGPQSYEDIRGIVRSQAFLSNAGLVEGSPKENMARATQMSEMARDIGLPGITGIQTIESMAKDVGAARQAGGPAMEDLVNSMGGTMGAAAKLSQFALEQTQSSKGGGVNATDLILRASMKKDGSLDMDKAQKLLGKSPIELSAAANTNMQSLGLNPAAAEEMLKYKRPQMVHDLEDESKGGAPGTLKKMAIAEVAARAKYMSPTLEGSNNPGDASYMAAAESLTGGDEKMARVLTAMAISDRQGKTQTNETEAQRAKREGDEEEAAEMALNGPGATLGRAKERIREGGADAMEGILGGGEGVAKMLIDLLRGDSPIVAIQQTLAKIAEFIGAYTHSLPPPTAGGTTPTGAHGP